MVGGSGALPKENSQVQIFYLCTDTYGKVLEQSKVIYTVNLQNTIKAWQEGIPKIPVGATYKFYVPPHLAYSYRGTKEILPFQTLIYTIELHKIVE